MYGCGRGLIEKVVIRESLTIVRGEESIRPYGEPACLPAWGVMDAAHEASWLASSIHRGCLLVVHEEYECWCLARVVARLRDETDPDFIPPTEP